MAFKERIVDGVTILDLDGRLTYSAGTEMSRRLHTLATQTPHRIVLNLENVSYIDSAGLGAMVAAFTAVKQRGGLLKFLNPSARSLHLLEITGLDKLIETFDSESAAVASFGPEVPQDDLRSGVGVTVSRAESIR